MVNTKRIEMGYINSKLFIGKTDLEKKSIPPKKGKKKYKMKQKDKSKQEVHNSMIEKNPNVTVITVI